MYLQKNYIYWLQCLFVLLFWQIGSSIQAQTTPAKLVITAVTAPTSAKVGDKITFQVTIKNTGGTASSTKDQIAIVRQQLGFLPQATFSTQGTPTNLAPLAAGASINIPLIYTIEAACSVIDPRQICIADLGGISPIVQVAGIGADFMPSANTDKVVFPDFRLTPTLPSVDLATTLQLTSKFANANGNFTYRIILKNNGAQTASNITLIPSKGTEIDPCQNGTILSMTPSKGKFEDNFCPNAFFWTGFDLAAGETATCDVAMNVKSTGTACFAFNYKVAVSQLLFCGNDTNKANNLTSDTFSPTSTVTPIPINGAKLTITNVAGATSAKVGDKITLQVTVKNIGNATSATDAQLAIVRKQTGFIQPYENIAQGTPVAIAPLAAGASRTIPITYIIETACDLARNPCELDRIGLSPTIQVAGIGKDFMPAANANNVVFPNFSLTPATPTFDLVTSIQQIGTGIPAGGNLKYRITLKNNGPDKATDIILQPKDGTSSCEIDKIVNLTPSKGNTGRACQDAVVYWNGLSLASGETATCDVEVNFTTNPLAKCPSQLNYTATIGGLSFCGKDTNEANNLATATLSKAEAPSGGTLFYANSIQTKPTDPLATDSVTINVLGDFANGCARFVGSTYVVVGNQIDVTLNFELGRGVICTQALIAGSVPVKLGKLPMGKYCVNLVGATYNHSTYDALPSGKCFVVSNPVTPPAVKPTLSISAEPQLYRQWSYNKITVTADNQTGSALTNAYVLIGIGSSSHSDDTLIIAEEAARKSIISKGTRFSNAWNIGTMPPNTKETWVFYTFAKVNGKNMPIKAFLNALSKGNILRESVGTILIPSTTTGGILTPPPTVTGRDIAITLEVAPQNYTQYQNLTFKAIVINQSAQSVNGVQASFEYIEQGKLPFVKAKMSAGRYNHVEKIWNIGTLNGNQTVTLELTVFPLVKTEDLNFKAILIPNDDVTRNNLAVTTVKSAFVPRSAAVGDNHFGIAKVYTNPIEDNFLLEIQSTEPTKAMIEIYNTMGLSVQRIEKNLLQGSNEILMDSSDFPYGVYIVRVVDAKGAHSTRTIIR
jgi:Domain of unknown function DUF11/Secretion system C-terminal sorting domain/CARDB